MPPCHTPCHACPLWTDRHLSVADLRGGREGRVPPGGPNSFNFMQFLGKFGKIVCWRPRELAPPPRGNPGSATGMGNPGSTTVFQLMMYCILAVYLLYTYCYIYFNLAEKVEMRIPIESPHIDSAVNFDTRLHSNKHFLSIEARRSPIVTNITSILFSNLSNSKIDLPVDTICMPQVSFAFEFESERPNGNSVTVLLLNSHSAVQTQTPAQKETEIFPKTQITTLCIMGKLYYKTLYEPARSECCSCRVIYWPRG